MVLPGELGGPRSGVPAAEDGEAAIVTQWEGRAWMNARLCVALALGQVMVGRDSQLMNGWRRTVDGSCVGSGIGGWLRLGLHTSSWVGSVLVFEFEF